MSLFICYSDDNDCVEDGFACRLSTGVLLGTKVLQEPLANVAAGPDNHST